MEQYQHLTQALNDLPTQIKNVQLELLNKSEEQAKTSADLQKLEAKIKSEINAAVDQNGKKLFSNAESREAELIERASSDLEIEALKQTQEILHREIAEARLEVELLNNQQRNARTLLDFFASVTA